MNRHILKLALPNIITNITVPLLGIVDLALMGHLSSPVYVGAIALGSTVFNIIYSSFVFLRMGASGLTSQAFGANNSKEVAIILQRSLVVSISIALMLILFMYPIQWLAFHILDGTNEVKYFARQYFYIRIIAAPATLGLYAMYGWYLGIQNSVIPMILAITVNIINIALNFLFVMVFGMKSDGVAWATVIAQYSGLTLALFFFFTKFKHYKKSFSFKNIIDRKPLRRFFRVNTDIFIRTVLFLFVLAFFTSRSARQGDVIFAANTLLFQLFYFFSYFADGFAFASEALAGKAKGAGNKNEMKMLIKYIFRWGWLIAALFTIIYGFGINDIMHVLSNNKDIINAAEAYYFYVVIIPLISIGAFIWDGIFIGITASRAMRNISITVSLFVFIPAYFITQSFWGNHALWFAFDLFMIARSMGMWFYARREIV
jgi:MATE family multidrug resistance protein